MSLQSGGIVSSAASQSAASVGMGVGTGVASARPLPASSSRPRRRSRSRRTRPRSSASGVTPWPLRAQNRRICRPLRPGFKGPRSAAARSAPPSCSTVTSSCASDQSGGSPSAIAVHWETKLITAEDNYTCAVAKVAKKAELSQGQLTEFLHDMLLIRRFEEKVEERFRAGELPGFLHVAIGQEAVCVGVCRAMEDGDVFASTHRAHGHTLARGTTPNALMAELYGKVEGCSHGYGGSMHLYDVERGNLGANAVVGGGLPAITGAALAFKFRREPRVAVAFFGDGATNIGTFHESLNLAQLWQVPAVFVCENNHWAESTPARQHMPIQDMTQRAVAFGMEAESVDGQDIEAVCDAAQRALKHARDGKGPFFLVAETFRLH